jgi:hypothetical protein
MATTAITPTQLVFGTESADILDANGTVADTPSDGWAITLGSQGTAERLLLKFLADGTGDTIVITAGDAPLAVNASKGSDSIVLAASDVRYYIVEPGRHEQDDNTIIVTCTDTGSTCKAFLLPVAMNGGSGIA